MTDLDIYIKLAALPEEMKIEVDNFVDYLKSKSVAKGNPEKHRKAGLAKGLIKMKEDFEEPLDDFKEYM
ncbi:DUF2281 domain-containing protein [Aquiflexum sp. TKW24L]|uniref:type II toxin-antitoxin system VapB family antitoxin n=1 Tax=Aquiflexum sp. TKW24L TaxID=2942212 RepID=UPI0020BECE0B|nr:DUF2281 domain-containing protein [Aquiflexum sp. TKW24L]MCL6261537.1 DUF2281 domain-containing protein [Aquiflexum sp. TKW24L]